MGDLDTTLNLLQNKVRRQILERLVREPHYPMQLADRIGVSQQAIMKHLKLLENQGLIETRNDKSNVGRGRTQYITMNNVAPANLATRIELDLQR